MDKANLRLRFLFLIPTVIYTFIHYYYLKTGTFQEESFTIMSSMYAFSFGAIISFLFENKKYLSLFLNCYLTRVRKQDVYVSLSYLYKIKLDGHNKYLVVKGRRISHQYQPVGGVYKKYNSATFLFNKWNARPVSDTLNPDDLRFFVSGKYVPDVILWFNTRENREIDVWREFYEELVKTNILPRDIFCHIRSEYLRSYKEFLVERPPFECKQVLIYDIYDIEFTPEQKSALEDLFRKNSFTDQYAFVDEDALSKQCFLNNQIEYKLSGHSKYLK